MISRLFTPEDFGVLGLFTSFVTAAAAMIVLSFPLAIVSAGSRRVSAQLAVISFATIIPMATLLAGVLALMRHRNVLGFGELPFSSVVFGWICSSLIGVFVTLRYWQVMEGQFTQVAQATVSQSVGRVVAQLISGILSLGGIGLLISESVGRAMGVTQLARKAIGQIRAAALSTPLSEYLAVIREFRKFPLMSTPSTLINSLSQALPVPLLAASYTLSISGQFSMAYRVLALPIAVIGAAVADVFHSHLAKLANQNMRKARTLFLQVAAGLLLIGIVPSVVIVLWGEEIFSLVLGPRWEVAGTIASGIMPWLLISFVVSPLSRVVLVFQGQEKKLIYDILAAVAVVGCIQLGSHFEWSISKVSIVLGASQSATYVVYFLLLWWILVQQGDSNTDPDDPRA